MEQNTQQQNSYKILYASFAISVLILLFGWAYSNGLKATSGITEFSQDNLQVNPVGIKNDYKSSNASADIPSENGVVLPIKWGSIGKELVQTGVIDAEKLQAIYSQRGGLSQEELNLINSQENQMVINEKNSGYILNLLWAFGLANKNDVLEKGPMMDAQYGGAGNFASTGGWTLAKGGAMEHYSRHALVVLTPEQQALVERVAKNIYRPCCNNSTYFPDCNHGMAMLGLLELLAANNIGEEQMYQIALKVNALWFPDTYSAIKEYFKQKGISWDKVDAKEVLGFNFSSASGYRKILSQITPQNGGSAGSGCGV